MWHNNKINIFSIPIKVYVDFECKNSDEQWSNVLMFKQVTFIILKLSSYVYTIMYTTQRFISDLHY